GPGGAAGPAFTPALAPGGERGAEPGSGSRYEDLAGVAGLVLLLTYAGTGHAVAGADPTLAMLADVLHLAAMAVWLGGLVMLLAGLLPLAGAAEVAVALPRFSRLAFGAVAVLVVTGVYRALGTVGAVAALWSTGYGRLLTVKVLAVSVLLTVADRSRRAVRRRGPAPGEAHPAPPPPAPPAPAPPQAPVPPTPLPPPGLPGTAV